MEPRRTVGVFARLDQNLDLEHVPDAADPTLEQDSYDTVPAAFDQIISASVALPNVKSAQSRYCRPSISFSMIQAC